MDHYSRRYTRDPLQGAACAFKCLEEWRILLLYTTVAVLYTACTSDGEGTHGSRLHGLGLYHRCHLGAKMGQHNKRLMPL